ncbi:MAG: tetratricopeptide repeat protein [Deltaproteobacteria bacterium]|nr:tetratricopeptide repeat protein [Deltaproteobacteria bacterium]
MQLGLEADAQNADVHVQAGRIAMRKGDLPKALEEANKALAKDAKDVGALYLLLRAQAQQGTVSQSLTRLQQLANTYRDDLGVQLAYGEAQLLLGQYTQARAAVTRVLTLAETSVPAMKLLARVYMGLKRPITAEYVLQRAIEIERDPEALTLLAGIRMGEGKLVQARVLLEEAIQTEPGYLEALNSLGVVYAQVRNFEASQEVLMRAVAAAPSFAQAWLDLGSAQRGLGQFEAAEKSWQKTLSLDAKLAEAWFNLGVLYLENPLPGKDRLRQLTDAINAFQGYKRGRAGAEQDPNAEKYIGEAQLLYKQEEEKRKQDLKTPPPAGDETTEPDAG